MSRCNKIMMNENGEAMTSEKGKPIRCKLKVGHSGRHHWYRLFGDRASWRWNECECEKMRPPMKKIKMYLYHDIIEELLKKEEGWIAELDSWQKELVDKTLHIMKENKKRKEKDIKAIEEMRELLQGAIKKCNHQ